MDSIINDVMEQGKHKATLSQVQQLIKQQGKISKEDLSEYATSTDLKKLRAKIRTQYNEFIRPTQFEKYMQSANITGHFLEEIYNLKTNYMSKRNAKKFIEISSDGMKDSLYSKVSGKMQKMIANIQINLNEKMNTMHGHLEDLNSMLNLGCGEEEREAIDGRSASDSSSSSSSVCDGQEGTCNSSGGRSSGESVNTVLTKLYEGIDITDSLESTTGTEKIEFLQAIHKEQKNLHSNYTGEILGMKKVHANFTKLIGELKNEIDAIKRLQRMFEKRTKKVDRITHIEKDLMDSQTIIYELQSHSGAQKKVIQEDIDELNAQIRILQMGQSKFKNSIYKMMASKSDHDSLYRQVQLLKASLRETKEFELNTLKKQISEIRDSDELKDVKDDIQNCNQQIVDMKDKYFVERLSAHKETVSEFEGFKTQMDQIESVLRTLFEKVGG